MSKHVEILHVQEIDGMSTSLLQDQVDRLQEVNWDLESQLEEACNILEELCAMTDLEDIEDILSRAKTFLEQGLFTPKPF